MRCQSQLADDPEYLWAVDPDFGSDCPCCYLLLLILLVCLAKGSTVSQSDDLLHQSLCWLHFLSIDQHLLVNVPILGPSLFLLLRKKNIQNGVCPICGSHLDIEQSIGIRWCKIGT